MSDLVSVVVPIYNAEKYLEQGIDSLISQTYNDLEIILVDDHSTDKSWKIAQSFAKKYLKKVFAIQTTSNSGGPFRPRVEGMKIAKGKWITTMDGDDFVDPKYIEHLVDLTENGKYDIAISGHKKVWSDGRIEEFYWEDFTQTSRERMAEFYANYIKSVPGRVQFWWNPADTLGQNLTRASIVKKAINSDIFAKIQNKVWAEDTLMAAAFSAFSKNGVNFRDYHEFNWRQVEGSGSHGGFSNRADQKSFYEAMDEIFAKNTDNFAKNLPLVSIIILTYNVEKYIKDTLISILNQTYKNIEIIIIDDKSPDNSRKIAEDFAKKDPRIKVISKPKNEGSNMARKTGVENSMGECIMFVDGDDMLERDAVAVLVGSALEYGVDIAIAGHKEFTNIKEIENNEFAKISAENNHEFREKVLKDKHEIIGGFLERYADFNEVFPMVAWSKLYRRAIIEKTDWDFANYATNEDNFELIQWLSFAKNGISITNAKLYLYRRNEKGKSLGAYHNTSPDGRELNAFEYDDELYEKAHDYLNDEYFRENLVKYYSDAVMAHARVLSPRVNFSQREANSMINSFAKIQNLYIGILRKPQIELEEENAHLRTEISKFISVKRSAKLFAGNVKRFTKKLVRKAKNG
jgi:glycosyltransferase involved in cell wall biosynthesis